MILQTVLEAVRAVLGEPDFYNQLTNTSNYTWDYGLMVEYLVSAILLMISVSWVFRIVSKLFG